jgi:hypothetical protein
VYPTIQAALDQVSEDYQVILIREGTYSGSGNVGLTQPADHPILLIGEKGAKTSLIDGQGTSRLLNVTGDAFIDGLTFLNGYSEEGGALHLKNGNLQVVNCVFKDNRAVQKGGAIFQESGNLSVIHSTLVGNTVGQGGSALQVESGDAVILKSILWNTGAGTEISTNSGTVEVSESLVKGGHVGDGNLDEEPMIESDGHLKSGSPAIDQGGILQTAMRDMDGDLRPVGVTTDIGADEWRSTTPGDDEDEDPAGEGGMPGSEGQEGGEGDGDEDGQGGPGGGPPGSGTPNGGENQGNEGSGGRIIYVDGEIGDDSKPGLQDEITANDAPKRTVTGAIEAAEAGDTIVLDGGVYPEALNFNFPGEGRVIISATEHVILGKSTVEETVNTNIE